MINQEKIFQCERLRLARTARGLTQAALAKQLGVQRQFVHQFENSERTPNEEILDVISEVLNVHSEFFFNSLSRRVSDEDVNFRSLKTAKKIFLSQVVSESTIINEMINWIAEKIQFPLFNLPQIDIEDDDRSIESASQIVREALGLGLNSPIDNVTTTLEVNGVICVQPRNISEKISALSVDTNQPFILHNTENKMPTRMRFDLAHELGHLIMHRGMITGDDTTESQADKFASAFLMPRGAFTRECPLAGDHRIDWQALREFKLRWKTSFRAVFRRAYDLNIIGPNLYRKGNITLSKNGYTKTELYEPNPETPSLLRKAIQLLQTDSGIFSEDFERKFAMNRDSLNSLLGVELEPRPIFSNNVIKLQA